MGCCFLSKINADDISIFGQVSNDGMFIQELELLLLIGMMFDELTNRLEAITPVGVTS